MSSDASVPAFGGGFELVRRGYDQRQVDGHLRRIDAEIRILAADRDAAVDQAVQLGHELEESRAREERLGMQIRSLVHAPQSVQAMSERMRSMLRMAEEEVGDMLGLAAADADRRRAEADEQAADVLGAAQAEAEAILSGARGEAGRVAAETERRRAELDEMCAAARRELVAERAEAEQRIAAATEQAERDRLQAWSESEARRAQVEEDFTLAMNSRRSRALAELEAARVEAHRHSTAAIATATEQARQQLAEAEQRARHMVTEAERRVGELTAARERIAEQLGNARRALDVVLAALPSREPEPSASEDRADGEPDEADGAYEDEPPVGSANGSLQRGAPVS